MTKLRLETDLGTLNLNGIFENGTGVQATSGALGFGLPPVSVQWLEGAGNGALFRGKRVLPRDIDLPLHFFGTDRAHLKQLLNDFSRVVSRECKLVLIEDDGTEWYTRVHRIGGGSYVYGDDTVGDRELSTVITFRAGDPFWTSQEVQTRYIGPATGRGLLGGTHSLTTLRISASDAFGEIEFTNDGDVDAYPVWTIVGPGQWTLTSPNGEVLSNFGTQDSAETFTIDTEKASVIDNFGDNRYQDLDTAPIFWTIPPGTSIATVDYQSTDANSLITVSWRVKKWLVV